MFIPFWQNDQDHDVQSKHLLHSPKIKVWHWTQSIRTIRFDAFIVLVLTNRASLFTYSFREWTNKSEHQNSVEMLLARNTWKCCVSVLAQTSVEVSIITIDSPCLKTVLSGAIQKQQSWNNCLESSATLWFHFWRSDSKDCKFHCRLHRILSLLLRNPQKIWWTNTAVSKSTLLSKDYHLTKQTISTCHHIRRTSARNHCSLASRIPGRSVKQPEANRPNFSK